MDLNCLGQISPIASCKESVCLFTKHYTFRSPLLKIIVILSARQDTVLPLTTPIKGSDGKEIREVPLRKGTKIIIGIMASNINPKLWGPDANEWKPERWLSPLPEEVIAAHLPGVYSHL